jgi:hypothetical protein
MSKLLAVRFSDVTAECWSGHSVSPSGCTDRGISFAVQQVEGSCSR